MRLVRYGLCAIAMAGISACSSSSGGGSSMSEEDSVAAAAAMAAGLAETGDDMATSSAAGPDGETRRMTVTDARRIAQASNCDSGVSDSGTENDQDVGSPYSATLDGVEWEHYEDCVIEDGGGVLNDGYYATASHVDGANEYSYEKWTSEFNHGFDAGDFEGRGFLIEGSLFGDWDMTMVGYGEETTGQSESEVYMDWIITIPDWESGGTLGTSHMTLGAGPGSGERMEFSETEHSPGTVYRTVDGYASFMVTGDGECEFAVTYTTATSLLVENVGTDNEHVESGELDISVDGGDTHQAEWINGQMYIDQQPYDPEDLPEACRLEQEAEF